MSVTIRPYRKGGWEVDIRVVTPDGTRRTRERKHAPISSRTAVVRWAAGRERVCCSSGFSLRHRRISVRGKCQLYKNSRRAFSTVTPGQIGRSRAGLRRKK